MPAIDAYSSLSSPPVAGSSPSPAAPLKPTAAGRCFCFVFSLLTRWPRGVLALWMVCGVAGAFVAPRFLKATAANGGVVPGTPVAQANAVYAQHFPEAARTDSAIALVTRSAGGSVLSNVTRGFTEQLEAFCADYKPASLCLGVEGYFSANLSSPAEASWAQSEFVSADLTATMVSVQYDTADNAAMYSFVDALRTFVVHDLRFPTEANSTERGEYTVGSTGMDLLYADTIKASENDMVVMDGVVLPLALLLLALYLRNVSLMLLPLLSVGLTIVLSFAIMLLIAEAMAVASFTPSIMVSISIALSIDYSLFMLTRYREERIKQAQGACASRMKEKAEQAAILKLGGRMPEQSPDPLALRSTQPGRSRVLSRKEQNVLAVERTLASVGGVVLLSGSTLAMTFLSLLFFPLAFLRSVGLGAAVAIMVCIAVNLTLLPAALLAFPGCFGRFKLLPEILSVRLSEQWRRKLEGTANMAFQDAQAQEKHSAERTESEATQQAVEHRLAFDAQPSPEPEPDTLGQSFLGVNADPSDQARTQAAHKQAASWWFRVADFTTGSKAWVVVLAVILLAAPFSLFVIQLRTSSDVNLIFPRNSLALSTYREMDRRFQPGSIDPFHVIATTRAGEAFSQELFAAQSQLIQTLLSRGLISNNSVTSISFLDGQAISFAEAEAFVNPASPVWSQASAQLYRGLLSRLLSNDHSATVMDITISFNPDGDDASGWIDSVRKVLSNADSRSGITFFLNGGATESIDSYRRINELFPMQVALTVSCVFVIVAALFRSLLVPLRLLFTIGLSLSFTYGFAVLVFQKKMFNWLCPRLAETDSLFWMEITMSFSILVGLGLDYDTFLFCRVREFRLLGYSTRAAVIKAAVATGEVITVAGAVMGIAFGGLMASQTMVRAQVLIQFGFLLCFAVLFDTFVVRTLLVPALLQLLGEANWWPGHMPPAKFDVDEFVPENDERIDADMLATPIENIDASPVPASFHPAADVAPLPAFVLPTPMPTRAGRPPSTDFTFLTSPTCGAGKQELQTDM